MFINVNFLIELLNFFKEVVNLINFYIKVSLQKQLQLTLKLGMKKIEPQNFDHRLGTIGYDSTQIAKFREQCKNIKLRHIYFRLVSRDFYTKFEFV